MPARRDNGLRGLIVDVGTGLGGAMQDLGDIVAVDQQLTDLERRIDDLASTVGAGGTRPLHRATELDELRLEAERRFKSRGVAAHDLLQLLDDTAAAERRRRYAVFSPFRIELDSTDVLAAITVGTAASIVDAFVVRIPKDRSGVTSRQRGSWLTKTLRDLSIPDDNWLASIAKVPFDRIIGTGEDIPGMGPLTHRVHTFGHDPLVGLLFGTLDILRGTVTGVGKSGEIGVIDVGAPVARNPLVAVGLELMHLLSDLPTRTGLPLPGGRS